MTGPTHNHTQQSPTDESYWIDGCVIEHGRCDTCGAPCDEQGCTRDRTHEVTRNSTDSAAPEPVQSQVAVRCAMQVAVPSFYSRGMRQCRRMTTHPSGLCPQHRAKGRIMTDAPPRCFACGGDPNLCDCGGEGSEPEPQPPVTDEALLRKAARALWEIDESLDDPYRTFDQQEHVRLGRLVAEF